MSVYIGASGVVRCILNKITLGFNQYCVMGSSCVITDNTGRIGVFKIFSLIVLRDGVGGRQAGSHSTRPHNHISQTLLLVPPLILSSIICR